MNAIIFYSNTNQSKRIADYLESRLGYALIDICKNDKYDFENAILVFPVYCQNIPEIVKAFLKRLSAKSLTLIATYGRMWHGNVLFEAQTIYKGNIVAGAYIPTKHSYLTEKEFDAFSKLDPIINKISNPLPVCFPRLFKNPLSDILIGLRSRMGVKITKNASCNNCGVCEENCPYNAIKCGKTNRKCIRCLRCAKSCPEGALSSKNSLPLKLYLSKKKTDKIIIYI